MNQIGGKKGKNKLSPERPSIFVVLPICELLRDHRFSGFSAQKIPGGFPDGTIFVSCLGIVSGAMTSVSFPYSNKALSWYSYFWPNFAGA